MAPFEIKVISICDLDQMIENFVSNMGILNLNEKCKAHANVMLSPLRSNGKIIICFA